MPKGKATPAEIPMTETGKEKAAAPAPAAPKHRKSQAAVERKAARKGAKAEKAASAAASPPASPREREPKPTAAAVPMGTVLHTEHVPFRPRVDAKLLAALRASFRPDPTRHGVPPHFREHSGKGTESEDDPRAQYDNTKSHVPWDDQGKFQTPEAMAALLNDTTLHDPFVMRALALPLTLFSFGGYALLKRRVIREGRFREVKRGNHTVVRMPGYHVLWSLASSWGDEHDIDDEHTLSQRRIGNKTLLRVRANHVASAYVVGDKYTKGPGGAGDPTAPPVLLARDGDLVLFSQGSYVLDESLYRNIHVAEIEDTPLIRCGDVTIMVVGPECVGGALLRGTQEYLLFHTGAPILFDNKEWCDFAVVRRARAAFHVGPYRFLTLSANQVACVGRKDGTHLFLSAEDTYQFHTKEWEDFHVARDRAAYDVGAFYVRSVGREQRGSVRSKLSGEYFALSPGKYVLYNKDWHAPEIVDLERPLVQCGPWIYLRVQEDFFTGGRHARTGKFVEFDSVGLHTLHIRDFPLEALLRVPKVSLEAQAFDEFKVITIPSGMWGVFEEAGALRISPPGTYKLSYACRILDPLPSCPQEFTFSPVFYTRDTVKLAVDVVVHWTLRDPAMLAAKLQSTKSSFEALCGELQKKTDDITSKALRQYSREQLIEAFAEAATKPEDREDSEGEREEGEEDGEATTLEATIVASVVREFNLYSEQSKSGIRFDTMVLTGGFKYVDLEFRRTVGQKARSDLQTRAHGAVARANKAEEGAKSVRGIEAREVQKEIDVLNQQTLAKVSDKLREVAQLQEAHRQTKIRKEEQARLEIREMEAEIVAYELKVKADADAYVVNKRADANYMRAQKENEAGTKRPASLVSVEEMERLVEALAAAAPAAWCRPEPLYELLAQLGAAATSGQLLSPQLMQALQKSALGGGGGGGGGGGMH